MRARGAMPLMPLGAMPAAAPVTGTAWLPPEVLAVCVPCPL